MSETGRVPDMGTMLAAGTSTANGSASEPAQSSERGGCLETRTRKQLGEFVLDVAFQAAPGFTIVFGPSGAGKTTVLDCVAGLVKPDEGRIQVGPRVLYDSISRADVPVAKRGVGYVFQTLALFPHLTVEQNVGYGLARLPRADRVERVGCVLRAFHIEHLAPRSARKISGGESQRVALARTLVTNPTVLLLDEPLSALDAPTKAKIIDDLREWNGSHRIPILYVTHSREEVFALGEHVIVLDRGRILVQGTPHEVMAAPLQETIAQLAGFENIFDATVEAVHPEQGSMTCQIAESKVFLETPLVRADVGSSLRVGIRAGDILLATSLPQGLSARNVIPGRVRSLEERDVIVSCRVQCGEESGLREPDGDRLEMEVHLTLAARDSLQLASGHAVWLVIKTHSCHVMRK